MSAARVAIPVFPASNCDRDLWDAATEVMGAEAVFVWHQETTLAGFDAVLIPGGFSYGDYLRAGALARFSPIMQAVKELAEDGKPVIGICNGFQILTESGLLPGALTRNAGLCFQCRTVSLRVENNHTPFTHNYQSGQKITLPIAHAEGNYTASPETLAKLNDNKQVIFRYVDEVNGSAEKIAGICNQSRTILGMMPHPERNIFDGGTWTREGRLLFESLKHALS